MQVPSGSSHAVTGKMRVLSFDPLIVPRYSSAWTLLLERRPAYLISQKWDCV